MEELEHPQEHVQEQINERAEESRERWISGVALTAAILAALAAVANLLSGHHEHEAMMDQLQASDQWGYYQAKGIKAAILEGRIEGQTARGEPIPPSMHEKLESYREDQKKIAETANERQAASGAHDLHHMILARGVTLFQVAIAVSAISALTRRSAFWYVGIALGLAGVGFLIQGLIIH